MAVIIGGLLLYVLYMVMLIYSSSPFMVGALPQSEASQKISALIDPFGLSAYFFQAKDFTVADRNHTLVPLSGMFLINRLLTLSFSFLLIAISVKYFSFYLGNKGFRKGRKIQILEKTDFNFWVVNPTTVHQKHQRLNGMRSIFSFVKVDLTYTFKSIVFYAICLLLLFYVGMEIHAAIDQEIRFPQHYVSSGLIAQTINKNFYSFGVFLSVYLVNEFYWRSRSANFSLVENASYFSFVKNVSHWLSISVLLIIFLILRKHT